MGLNAKTVRCCPKSNVPNLGFQCRWKISRFASITPLFGSCITNDPIDVLCRMKRREGTSFGCNVRQHEKMTFLSNPQKWQRAHLFHNCSCTAVPTLRLFGNMVATQYVDFKLINGEEGSEIRGCIFRLFAAPPVYAPKSFSPPFGSARFGPLRLAIFGVQEWFGTDLMGRCSGGGAVGRVLARAAARQLHHECVNWHRFRVRVEEEVISRRLPFGEVCCRSSFLSKCSQKRKARRQREHGKVDGKMVACKTAVHSSGWRKPMRRKKS